MNEHSVCVPYNVVSEPPPPVGKREYMFTLRKNTSQTPCVPTVDACTPNGVSGVVQPDVDKHE